MPLQLVPAEITDPPLPPIFSRLRLVEAPPDNEVVTYITIPAPNVEVRADGGYDIYPGSLFPGQVDRVRNHPHPQTPDAIMALETFLIGGVGPTLPGAVFTGDVTAVPPAAFIGNGAVPVGGTLGQILTKTGPADYAYAWQTPAPSGITIPLSQNLTFSPDNTYDIGASGANRPRDVYISGRLYTATGIWLDNGTVAAPIGLNSSGLLLGNIWQIDSSTGAFGAQTDNSFDIGASGANRPRTIYAATSFIGPGAVPTGGTAGQVLSKVDATNYNLQWITPSAGGITLPLSQNLTFSPDGTYDIGASAASRPRTVYAATSLVIGADVNLYRGTLAGSMDQRGGATGQSYRLYVAYTDASNYERLRFTAATTGHTIASESLGTGTVRGITLSTTGAGAAITFTTASAARWNVSVLGHFLANSDNAVDIGSTGANRPRNLYMASYQEGLQIAKPSNAPASNRRLYAKTDGWYDLDSAGVETRLGGGGLALPLTQALTFSPNNAYDVGDSSGTTQPRTVYAATSVEAPLGRFNGLYLGSSQANQAYVRAGSFGVLWFGSNGNDRWSLDTSGNFTATPDNTLDIGGSGSGRPRTIYAGTSFIGPGAVPTGGTTGQVLQKATATNYDVGWVAGLTLPLTQTLTFSGDGLINIGAAATSRPGTVYVAGDVVVPSVIASTVGTVTAVPLSLRVNSNTFWTISTSGHFLAGADNTYDIGASGATRPRDLYLGRTLTVGPSSRLRYPANDANSISLESPSGYSFQSGASGAQLAYNAYYDGSAWQRFSVGSTAAQWAIYNAGLSYLTAGSGANPISWGAARFTVDMVGNVAIAGNLTANGALSLGGSLQWQTDGAYDIGANGNFRPRDVWITGVFRGNSMTLNGNLDMNGQRVVNLYDVEQNGSPIAGTGFVRMRNNSTLGWRNAANTADLTIGFNASDQLVLPNASITTVMLAANSAQQVIGQYAGQPTFSTTNVGSWITTPATVNVTSGGGTLRIEALGTFFHSAAGAFYYVAIFRDGAALAQIIQHSNVAGYNSPFSLITYDAITAGAHTYDVRVNNQGAGTLTLQVAATLSLYVNEQKR